MTGFEKIEDAVKTMKKEELKQQILAMNDVWNDFEAFLAEKFGTGKVESLSQEFVLWKAKKDFGNDNSLKKDEKE